MTRTVETSYGTRSLEPLLDIDDVCLLLKKSRATVYRIIDAGELVPIRVGGTPRFAPDELRAYLHRHRQER
jgi:excisionase family DNA binding protein